MNTNLAYQDDAWEKRREEVIDGEVVMMSPRPAFNHNRVSSNIFRIFDNHLMGKKCIAIADGTDLFLDEDNRFVPDFMVVCDPDKIKHNGIHGVPDLVAEVLSPGTARNDRGKKKDAYEKRGVREYWLVDPVSKSIEQYLQDNGQFALHDVYTHYPDYMLEDMTEEERAAVVTHFQCSLFDDLDLFLEDIFYRTF